MAKRKNCIVLTPDTLVKLPDDIPVIFVIGPVTNAPDYHAEIVSLFVEMDERAALVIPRKPRTPGAAIIIPELTEEYPTFANRLEWEEYYLSRAGTSENGCLLIWLMGELQHYPEGLTLQERQRNSVQKEDAHKVYAFKTQYQLARWTVKAGRNNYVVGGDGTYPEWNEVVHDIKIDRPHVFIYETLREACYEAFRRVVKKEKKHEGVLF